MYIEYRMKTDAAITAALTGVVTDDVGMAIIV